MNESQNIDTPSKTAQSFFDQSNVRQDLIAIGGGVPVGIKTVNKSTLGIGGAYGTWGRSYNNKDLIDLIGHQLGEPLIGEAVMDLAQLGFISRHHVPDLSDEENTELEIEVGAKLLREAALSNGWKPDEVQAVLIGMSAPVCEDYLVRVARKAGIPEQALKVSVHKACDGSVGALNLALNPDLSLGKNMNLAEELLGKKVLVGGIEGLSRFIFKSHDKNALQLFGNGAGVIGIIPGETMNFIIGKNHEVYDEEGALALHMYYPHSRKRVQGKSMIEVTQTENTHFRVAGLMHEPQDGAPIAMAGLMGMVKLFVRSGVQVVSEVIEAYRKLMDKKGKKDKTIDIGIVHHANYKINLLKAKQLEKIGIRFPMPWLLNDFGNVSAASNMIAFLRQLPKIKPGSHVLFDGFGAGTYYDVVAVTVGI